LFLSDQVAVPDFSAGAMENWGLVIYRQTALLFDKKASAASSQYFVTLVIAHEVAHTVSILPILFLFSERRDFLPEEEGLC
jgi:hypothetical protein